MVDENGETSRLTLLYAGFFFFPAIFTERQSYPGSVEMTSYYQVPFYLLSFANRLLVIVAKYPYIIEADTKRQSPLWYCLLVAIILYSRANEKQNDFDPLNKLLLLFCPWF